MNQHLLLVMLAIPAGSLVTFGVEADARRIAHEALEAPLDLDLRNVPPPKLADLLRERLGVPVVLDERALREAGITPITPLNFRIRRVPARVALGELLGQVGLTYIVRRGAVVITSWPAAIRAMEVRGYPVSDLVGRDGRYYRDLMEQIRRLVAPPSWKDVGGPGDMTYELAHSQLVVSNAVPVHEILSEHLVRLREARRQSAAGMAASPSPAPRPADAHRLLTNADVIARLEQPARLEIVARPLGTVLKTLEDSLQVSIVPNHPALDAEGIMLDRPVTVRVERVTYKTALELLLKPLDLTFVDREGYILVTTQLDAAKALDHEFFPVADVARDRDEVASLEEMLQATVADNSWSDVGGSGSIWYDAPGKLWIVSQTRAVHRQIAAWLDRLRHARRRATRDLAFEPNRESVSQSRPVGVLTKADVYTKLQQPVSFDFPGVALEKAIAALEKQCGLSFVVDQVALEEDGIAANTPVTLQLNQVPAGSALKLLLRELDLTYLVADGYALITSPLQADNSLELEFYPIGDLARTPEQVEAIADLIERTIQRDSWSRVGGRAKLQRDYAAPVLLITQTQAAHERIAELLTQARRKGR